MSQSGSFSERTMIFTPNGRDGKIAELILGEAGLPTDLCSNLPALCEELNRGAGAAIIADEAIRETDLRPLVHFLAEQPPWSDFPIILLTQQGGGPERNPAAVRLAENLGNVLFVERPFHPTTLASVARTAIRGRRRQYEARARLEELKEGEQLLQTALEAGDLGQWTFHVSEMILRPSETYKSLFGRGAEQPFTYDDLERSIHPQDKARQDAAIEQTLRSGTDYAMEFRTIWPDLTVHWIDVRGRALRNDDGAVDQIVGVASDITVRKNSELERERLVYELAAERTALADLTTSLELRVEERTKALMIEVAARERAQEQLLQAQKVEAIGLLTGGVAHDFNNLLMAVMGNLELLRKRLPEDSRANRLIDGAMQGAQRGASLTQRMLAFAKQQDLKTNAVDLPDLLLGMQDLLNRTLGPQTALTFDISERLPPAQVDANQIELAILNLAINARDAMPEGGRINVSVDQQRAGAERNLPAASYLRVRVSDTGSGMDGETLKKAIEPFFSTKPLGKGTGLGLSMVHGLAVQLGGTLELSSEIGKGTVATLWLPIAAECSASEKKPAVPEDMPSRRATILVVDDDPLVVMSTVDMLEDLGHTVLEAHSGRQALEILETAPQDIDLLMTDHAMPGMTGIQLAKIVRGKRPAMPVLLATGYADSLADSTNLPRLAKPYQQRQLQTEINRLLGSVGTR